jgi:hypothetical protein
MNSKFWPNGLNPRIARLEKEITWRVIGKNYEGPENQRWGGSYEAIVGNRPYVPGESAKSDAALAEALVEEAKITAGEIYKEHPQIIVEQLMIIRDITEIDGRFNEPEFPETLTVTHERFILVRRSGRSWSPETKAVA